MSWPTLRQVGLRLFKPWKVIKRTAEIFQSLTSDVGEDMCWPIESAKCPNPLCSGALALDYWRLWTWVFVILIALHAVSLQVLALISTELVVVDIELACSNRGGGILVVFDLERGAFCRQYVGQSRKEPANKPPRCISQPRATHLLLHIALGLEI